MVTDPDRFLDDYLEAGADRIDFHLEPFAEPERTRRAEGILERLERAGVERGIAISPATPVEIVLPWLDRLEAVLVMTVEPGFGGQSLIPECAAKIPVLRIHIERIGRAVEIGVDGGVKPENAAAIVASGAGLLVAGSAVFRDPDPAGAVARLRQTV
jgi:ribulose-phosphate 3-epimerase